MTKTHLMTIKIRTEIMIADVSFNEGFVCVEEIKHYFRPTLTEIREKKGFFDDNTSVIWLEKDDYIKRPVVYPAEDLGWAYFGDDIEDLPRDVMFKKDYDKLRKELGFDDED